MRRRVVITGMGIWSCIGQDLQTVTESLRQGKSGIVFDPKRIEYGLQSGLVGNVPRPNLKNLLPRKFRATMSEDAEYAYMAARQALEQAKISDDYIKENEVGIIFGSDYVTKDKVEVSKIMLTEHCSQMLDPNCLFQSETSSVTMNLSGIFHLYGINLCIGAACASSAHAIGLATTFIQQGMQDMILVGGANEISYYGAVLMDEVYYGISLNTDPQGASRPFDTERDGIVMSGGAAALVLEEYEHAKERGALILAEIKGVGISSDGTHTTNRDVDRIALSFQRAIDDAHLTANEIEYVHSFASSSINDDLWAVQALNKLFAKSKTWIGSTESMTGHEHDMAGASHCIYSILMMLNGFIAPNCNLTHIMPEASELRISKKVIYQHLHNIMVTSSGLGGTNCALVLSKI